MKKWNNDKLQFARLICEMLAIEEDYEYLINHLTESMELSRDEITELFNRAEPLVQQDSQRHS